MPFRYPIALEIEGRRCVVVGGGEVAEHKARALIEAGGTVAVVADRFIEGLEELGRRGEVELVRKPYSDGDLEGAFLAIAATDERSVNAEIRREADERRVLLNAVDDIANCHFAVPSIVRRGDFLIAVSTGGKAPALSKRLRRRLAKQFGPEYGALVDLLGEVREEAIGTREVGFDEWARRWQAALDHDLLGLVREGRAEEARRIVRHLLDAGTPPPPLPCAIENVSRVHIDRGVGGCGPPGGGGGGRGRVSIVGAGPGDPGLLTVRGRELIDAADVVVYDRLVDPALFEGKPGIYAGKEPGRHTVPQVEINALLVRLAREGRHVVRLKGGDPFVFGRGAEEAEALAEAGIPFEVVPAPTSAIAALAYAGIPVTDRRFASSVAIVTGHCAGDREVDWRRLATAVDTIVILMGLEHLSEITRGLIEGGRDPRTPAAIVTDGTLDSQRVIASDLAGLEAAAREARVRSPAVIVVGEVVRVRERIGWFEEQGGVRRRRAKGVLDDHGAGGQGRARGGAAGRGVRSAAGPVR